MMMLTSRLRCSCKEQAVPAKGSALSGKAKVSLAGVFLAGLVIAVALFSGGPMVLAADNDSVTNCMDITSSGTYILINDISDYGSTCFTISASDVIFDCNGHTIDGTDASDTYGIMFYGASNYNITVNECVLNDWYYGIGYMDGSTNNKITNTTINDGFAGIMLWNDPERNDYNIIENVTIENISDAGIFVYGSSYNTIRNSTLINCSVAPAESIYLTTSSRFNTIEYNTIYDGDYGVAIGANSHNNRIFNNTIRNCNQGIGIMTDNNTIYQNLIYGNTQNGIYMGNGADNNSIYNNWLNNTLNVEFVGTRTGNSWNVSKQSGDNIYNSNNPNIAGNYWTDPDGNFSDECADADSDGFCDEYYNVSTATSCSGAGCGDDVDYLALSDEYLSGGNSSVTNCMDITSSGVYTLINNVSSGGTCFYVKSDDVVLDCGGYWINYSTSSTGYAVNFTAQDNITVRNCNIIDGNSQGGTSSHAIYGKNNSTNITIYNNTITTTKTSGMAISSSASATQKGQFWNITGNTIDSKYFGINFYYNENSTIANNNINADDTVINLDSDCKYTYVYGNVIESSEDVTGIYPLSGSDYLQIYDNNITVGDIGIDLFLCEATNITGNRITSDSNFAIRFQGSDANSKIYNNILNGSSTPASATESAIQYWNTTKQTAENIYNATNPYVAGNYWTNSSGTGYSDSCTDSDTDGFCDNPYNVSTDSSCVEGSSCGNNVDYLPLSDEYFVDNTPPDVNFISPTATNGTETENKTYIVWNISVSENVGLAKIEINGTNQTAVCVNASADSYCYYNETGLTGNVTRCAWGHASDAAGNWNTTSDYICRSTNEQQTDTDPPDLTWDFNLEANNTLTSENKTWIFWNFTSDEAIGTNGCKVEINGTNQTGTIDGLNCYYNETGLSGNQTRCTYGWANDTSDNWNKTEYRCITTNEQQTPPDVNPPAIQLNTAGGANDNAFGTDISNRFYRNGTLQEEDWIYINVTATDDVAVSTVLVNWKSGSGWTNYTMTNEAGTDYYYLNLTGQPEFVNYTFDIYANDTSNKWGHYIWVFYDYETLWGTNESWRKYVGLNSTTSAFTYQQFYFYNTSYTSSRLDDRALPHEQPTDTTEKDSALMYYTAPTANQEVNCTSYIGFYPDERIAIANTTIDDIYIHIWWNTNDDSVTIGYEKENDPEMRSDLDESYVTTGSDSKKNVTGLSDFKYSTYHLEVRHWDISDPTFDDNEINLFAVKLNRTAQYPSVVTSGNYTTFVIFNLHDNSTLQSLDTDSDGYNDFLELFTHYTDPKKNDTDGDGVDDGSDIDPLDPTITSKPSSLTCDTCQLCTDYATNFSLAIGGVLSLSADITCDDGDCVNFTSDTTQMTFDCAGHTISGDGDTYGYGIYLNGANNITIQGCSNISYFDYGIFLSSSDNNTIYNSTAWGNSIPYTGSPCASGSGIRLFASGSNNISHVNTSQNCLSGIELSSGNSNIFDHVESRYHPNSVEGYDDNDMQIYSDSNNITSCVLTGIELKSAANYNLIYNNNISYATVSGTDNYFNTTKTLGTNIIGGPYIGGNYWSSYSGNDYDGDGLGDSSHTVDSSPLTYDYLPLFLSGGFGSITATTPDNDQNWSFSSIPEGEELLDIHFISTGNVSNTVYFTLHEDLANSSVANVNSTANLTLDDDEYATFNLTINASCPVGSYSGNLTWASSNSTESGNITVNFTVASQSANIDILNASWSAAFTAGETADRYFAINNTGNYNATHCNMSYSSSAGSCSFDRSDFTIENGTSVTVKATFSGASEDSDSSARIDLICTATATGGTDSDSVVGSISIAAESGAPSGGGGGTEVVVKTGNWSIVQPSFTIVAGEGSETVSYITIDNRASEAIEEITLECLPSTCSQQDPCSCVDLCRYVNFTTQEYVIKPGQQGKVPFIINFTREYAQENELPEIQPQLCFYSFSITVTVGDVSQPASVYVLVIPGGESIGRGISWLGGSTELIPGFPIPNWLLVVTLIILAIIGAVLVARALRPKKKRWWKR